MTKVYLFSEERVRYGWKIYVEISTRVFAPVGNQKQLVQKFGENGAKVIVSETYKVSESYFNMILKNLPLDYNFIKQFLYKFSFQQ